MTAKTLLPIALECAVNLGITELLQQRPDRFVELRDRWLSEARPGDIDGAFSEAVLCRIPGQTGPAFAKLARALAAMAFQPGGVRFAGLHFEIIHPLYQYQQEQEQAA